MEASLLSMATPFTDRHCVHWWAWSPRAVLKVPRGHGVHSSSLRKSPAGHIPNTLRGAAQGTPPA